MDELIELFEQLGDKVVNRHECESFTRVSIFATLCPCVARNVFHTFATTTKNNSTKCHFVNVNQDRKLMNKVSTFSLNVGKVKKNILL